MHKNMYCQRVMLDLQHFVSPGQIYVTGTQPPLAPTDECVYCLERYSRTKKPRDLDLSPMTVIFNRLLEIVKAHNVRATFHQAKYIDSWITVLMEWQRWKQHCLAAASSNEMEMLPQCICRHRVAYIVRRSMTSAVKDVGALMLCLHVRRTIEQTDKEHDRKLSLCIWHYTHCKPIEA